MSMNSRSSVALLGGMPCALETCQSTKLALLSMMYHVLHRSAYIVRTDDTLFLVLVVLDIFQSEHAPCRFDFSFILGGNLVFLRELRATRFRRLLSFGHSGRSLFGWLETGARQRRI